MTRLFSSLELRETSIPNRVMVSPMCQYSCEDRDGLATAWHRTHLGSRAVGGAGVVMAEATAVEPRGRISPEDLGIWSDEHADALAPVAEFVREQGSVPAIQLAHAGRKASTTRPWEGHGPIAPGEGGWTVVGPTDDPWPHDGEAPPTERLTPEEIEGVVESFRAAAERSLAAGFEIAEVHAAHGYLLHQFLSPVTNTRGDAYGGGFEGRTRLLRAVTEAVRDVWPDGKPVFVRLSATDWLPDRDSWTVEDSIRLADRLAELGVDLIDVSGGGIHPDSSPERTGPNYQVRYAERVREETDREIAVGAVGGITTPEQAEAVVANGRADLAIVGREHLRDPYFALRAAQALDATDEIEGPPQYRRAFGF
ncbi:NADH:flavin oxidoreductase, Old Yellow Enzyme family [Halapricum desulfuricans]|uniref:NADH:flavin oxidoreductase, Old Yellow Enzyme family n=1 Tax=Halapricum desulfuricans TaxID=2841257 RepID=A0A897NK57_9EURY|nr:NADH:flavin oxidoreductase/NADH oxidase [Halapricum desulfuricans]QSG12824.1 NADH:flavin oxidoreductase, Old Yellow Enzyme family [Halapricum desulfuricans]